jgi:protein TonB
LSLAWGQRGSPIQEIGLSRSRTLSLAIATATVLCLHAGLLLVRLEASGSNHASVDRAMAVRLLPARVIDIAAARDTDVDPPLVAPRDREPAESLKAVPPAAKETQRGAKPAERGLLPAPRPAESPPPVEPAPTAQPAVRMPPVSALAAAPDYLLGAGLDPGPRPLGSIEPEYPDSANLQEGKVVLRLLISEAGVVDNVAVVRADPKGLFEDAALEAFRSAKFSPGMVLGTPVKSQITVEVEFLPINRGARISGRMY